MRPELKPGRLADHAVETAERAAPVPRETPGFCNQLVNLIFLSLKGDVCHSISGKIMTICGYASKCQAQKKKTYINKYGGFLKWGYPQSSSISAWGFPL
jgi:hypothetical protein